MTTVRKKTYNLDTSSTRMSISTPCARTKSGRSSGEPSFHSLRLTFVSAVVAYELSVDAANERTQGLIREFLEPVKRTGRLVAPSFDDWLEAAEIVGF